MKKLLAIVLLSCAATVALAQTAALQGPQGSPQGIQGVQGQSGNPQRMARMVQQLQTRFANANTTHDGKLTKDQAAAGMPMVARHFDEIDTQKAGYITLPQIEAFMQQRAAAH
ncbi:EF-hand domain-containing protein [Paraburkholderia xenovorans]|uniref:EF-hand domain-containing protein n=1 Tax=Paraburkholderia xenovorans TaxID=36873 RepID=UPI0015C57A84|nr:EF-hand domain-containing protein [Paraburkholderia xenovorans]NPT35829.1 EF-hand domain-containing protein [Paraburkholderia xenovorans]